MNLLMRALDKATKDRNGTPASVSPATRERGDLSLEPILSSTRATDTTESSDSDALPQWDTRVAAPERKSFAAGASFPRPLTIFVTSAVIFAAGYGYYVYRQLNGLDTPASPARATPPPAPATVPASGEPPRQQPASVAEPLATAAVVQRSPAHASLTATSEPVGTPSRTPKIEGAASPPARGESAAPPSPASESAAASRPAEPPARSAAPAAASPPRQSITVSRGGGVTPPVNPVLSQAYGALQVGHYDEAQRLYTQVERGEPRSIDALLGLAAVALHSGKADEAVLLYMRVLETDPRNSVAQAALLALVGQEDPVAAESRLKRLLERDPSAFLYFTLGNLYAGQSQWAPAQQAFFRAHHLDPGNADYTYNLAVGLDHVGQHRIALGFYRRAIELARHTGRANFDTAQAEERINRLSAQAE